MNPPVDQVRTKTAPLSLTPALRAELQWLAGEGPPNVARHARIVLCRAAGMSAPAAAAAVGVHANTVRNCVRRFESHGLRGLLHGSAGKPKNIAFSDAIRDEIARVAMHSPASAGEPYAQWSLRRLQRHVLRRGVVQSISVEGLRQLLGGLPLPPTCWRRAVHLAGPLSPDLRRGLESLANGQRADRSLRAQIVLASHRGLNEAEIATALHVGRGPVRRWLRRFRRFGILGLQTLPRRPALTPQVEQAIRQFAAGDPRRHGGRRSIWTIESLRSALIRERIVRGINTEQLRGVLQDDGTRRRGRPEPRYLERPPAVG
jgi:transposase